MKAIPSIFKQTLNYVKELNKLDPKQRLNMQKDKVGLNICTIEYTFKVSLLPETARIDTKQ